jgi:hypothetical protein
MALASALDLISPHNDVDLPHPPANVEAEQALLGALLYDNAAFERLGDNLEARHFYEPFHQRLFAAVQTQIRKGQLAEPILLAEQFSRDPAFEALGGVRYFADLIDRAPPAANAPDYARAIYDLALRRDLIRIGGEITVRAQSPEDAQSAMDQIEAAEVSLYTLAETGGTSQGFIPFVDALGGALEMAAEAGLSVDELGFRELMAEQRSFVADAGVLHTEVVLVAERSDEPDRRWVYLDIGLFVGLAESLGEAIRYRIRTPHDGTPSGRVALAGPTCDSTDVLYERSDYRLPLALRAGDRIELLATGAYTTSYASVGFNGFAPLEAHYLPGFLDDAGIGVPTVEAVH